MRTIDKIMKDIGKLEGRDNALIASPYSWVPDSEPSAKFGGDGVLISIDPRLPALLEELARALPDGIESMSIELPASASVSPLALDYLSEPMPAGHGKAQEDLIKKAADSDECAGLAASAAYDGDPSYVRNTVAVDRGSCRFVRTTCPRGTLHGLYAAEIEIAHDDLSALVRQSMSHVPDREELLDAGVFYEKRPASSPRP